MRILVEVNVWTVTAAAVTCLATGLGAVPLLFVRKGISRDWLDLAVTTLTDTERQDGLADVASMRSQLAKATPNRRALAAFTAGLPTVAALADIADKLRQLLG